MTRAFKPASIQKKAAVSKIQASTSKHLRESGKVGVVVGHDTTVFVCMTISRKPGPNSVVQKHSCFTVTFGTSLDKHFSEATVQVVFVRALKGESNTW